MRLSCASRRVYTILEMENEYLEKAAAFFAKSNA